MEKLDRSNRKNRDLVRTLLSLVRVLEDGQKGMAELGERLQDPALRRYFLVESLARANFRGELENILHRHGMADVHETGTASAALYRAWAGLKSALGAGDPALLETAEHGEDETRDAYRTALAADLPLPIRQLLTEQHTHILVAQDFLRQQRDSQKAA